MLVSHINTATNLSASILPALPGCHFSPNTPILKTYELLGKKLLLGGRTCFRDLAMYYSAQKILNCPTTFNKYTELTL